MLQVNRRTVQSANLLQIFAGKGKTAYVAFLVEKGYLFLWHQFFRYFYHPRLDPEAVTEDEPHWGSQPPMWHAWLYDRVSTMAELAKHTEPSMEIRNSSVWGHVEKERERGWQVEMMTLLHQKNKLLQHLVKTSGVDPNEILK